VAAPASPSSDDPETLKALLAEERAENERLRQIILVMQRHRFGRRAESLPEDQLLLGLEEAEQVETLAKSGTVRLAYCWSHVRRQFYDLAAASPIATETLSRIAVLYRIEAEIRGRSGEERRAARQERSRPVVEALEAWLREKLGLLSRKSNLAEAIRYALTRWAGLSLFLDDGRVEIDSNTVERAIRPLALNRKNALFAGSDGGGEHWAVIASLIETCKLNGVEPQAYLADVITRIVEGHPQRRLDELLPWAYPSTPTLQAVA
jgi:transposase